MAVTGTAARAGPAPRVLVPLQIDGRLPAFGHVVHTMHGRTMGTGWSVRLVGPSRQDTARLQQAVQDELDEVVAQMSHWEPASDLCRFNAAAPGSWQALPAPLCEVLDCALQVAAASGGAFDPTAGALVQLWGFGPGAGFAAPGFMPPPPRAIDAARARCGWQRLALEAAGGRARQPGGLQLDLSAIAKGHAVDRVARRLQALGVDAGLVEVGGELRGWGMKADGQPWWVDLALPPATAGAAPATTRVALHGLAVATSGDYVRCFHQQGRRFPHSVDPRSGWPIAHGLASVTVLHPQCMWADAWSTALTVLGLDEGLRLADARGLAALFLQRRPDGSLAEAMSPALAALA